MPITVYIKAGPDGKSIGDCPFSQKVINSIFVKHFVLLAKNDFHSKICFP